jgi:APA family basic amino acid/polyamine antiporter
LGPYVVPALSIAACLYLMLDLSPATVRVFTVWMTVAVATYFLYGIRHSRLNRVAAEVAKAEV